MREYRFKVVVTNTLIVTVNDVDQAEAEELAYMAGEGQVEDNVRVEYDFEAINVTAENEDENE